MIKKDYEYCPKCGCVVGAFTIKEGIGGIGITQEMFCDNYCRMCGEKINTTSFKNKVDKLAKDILETDKQTEKLKELFKKYSKPKKVEYCERCNCLREYEIKNEKYEITFQNKLIKYDGKKAVCKHCGTEVFCEEVEEYNQTAFEKEVFRNE